jgi:SAM-dependent methyltransferase
MFSSGLSTLKSSKKKINNLLDIGCSNGIFLDLVNKNNIQTHGIELNKKEYEISSKKHNVDCASIFSYSSKIKYDCITMWDVIEHIKDTHKLLRKIKSLLNPNGLFFFQTPNANSLASTILHEKCNMFDGIEHCNLFSLKSIKMIAKKHSFQVKKINTVISEIPIINNHLNFDDPYLGKNRDKKILNTISEKVLHKKLLGYKFQAVLQKKNEF